MIFKLCMDHQGLTFFKVCINDDPGLTLAYFTAWASLVKFAYCANTRPMVRWAFTEILVILLSVA